MSTWPPAMYSVTVRLRFETANGSLKRLQSTRPYSNWITVVIQELIHAKNPDCGNMEGMVLLVTKPVLVTPNWGQPWD